MNEYEPGSYVDLTPLNEGGASRASKKSSQGYRQSETNEQSVGTHFSLRQIGQDIKAFRSIPVLFA
jgi:hypothetical protein